VRFVVEDTKAGDPSWWLRADNNRMVAGRRGFFEAGRRYQVA
jgi:hypothetical protein